MSFYVEFSADNAAMAAQIIDQQYMPKSIKEAITQALYACGDRPVYVHAYGHLYQGIGTYELSTVNITVKPINFTLPLPVPEPGPTPQGDAKAIEPLKAA